MFCVTEVSIVLVPRAPKGAKGENFLASASVVFDGVFVVHELKVVKGTAGVFVSFPSKRISAHCFLCNGTVFLADKFCRSCGEKQPARVVACNDKGRPRLYADVAHPLSQSCRDLITMSVLHAYQDKLDEGQKVETVV